MVSGPERVCLWCGGPLPTFSRSSRQYCSDACRKALHLSTESAHQKRTKAGASPRPNGPEPGTVASVPFMLTNEMKAKLRARGVHPDVIRELRPEDAHSLLDTVEPVPLNATRSPGRDLHELAAILAGQDSARLAQAATSYARGVVITPATIDAIKAGGEVMYAIRDAIWLALS